MKIRSIVTAAAGSATLALSLSACQSGATTGSAPAATSSTPAAATQAPGTKAPGTQSSGQPTTGATKQGAPQQSVTGTKNSATTGKNLPATSAAQTPAAAASKTCAPMTAHQAVQRNISRLPSNGLGGVPWVEDPTRNHYDPCAPLSYAVMTVRGSTASSPSIMMLFHNGRYLGTDRAVNYAFTPAVKRISPNTISATYIYLKGDECTACASGRSTVTFRWSDSLNKVVTSGTFPR